MTTLVTPEPTTARRPLMEAARDHAMYSAIAEMMKRRIRRVPVPAAVNGVRRAVAIAEAEYGLKPTGRQRVRFRRWMRANGHPLFQRGVGR